MEEAVLDGEAGRVSEPHARMNGCWGAQQVWSYETSVERKNAAGGTAKSSVLDQVREGGRPRLDQAASWHVLREEPCGGACVYVGCMQIKKVRAIVADHVKN